MNARKLNRNIIWLFVYLMLWASFCSDPVIYSSGGSGTETPNAMVICSTQTISGKAIPGVKVFLYGINYLPFSQSGFSANIICGDDSNFLFANLNTGFYNVLLIDTNTTYAALVDSMLVGDSCQCSHKRLVTFCATGGIKGIIRRDTIGYAIIYTEGMPFFTQISSQDSFQLIGLPAATFLLSCFDTITGISYQISVLPNSQPIPAGTDGRNIKVSSGKITSVDTMMIFK